MKKQLPYYGLAQKKMLKILAYFLEKYHISYGNNLFHLRHFWKTIKTSKGVKYKYLLVIYVNDGSNPSSYREF